MIQDLIKIDHISQTPLFRQVSEQIKCAVANNKIKPGERLPTIRQVAQTLHINPGTIARAYLELEQDHIVWTRRGGGTTIADKPQDPEALTNRRTHLSNISDSYILKALSEGYNPEELEAIFTLQISRWREERKAEKSPVTKKHRDAKEGNKAFTIVASHDLALNLLINRLKNVIHDISVEVNYAGSLGGLIALQEGRADLAGIHLLDEETGEYNQPYLRHLLPNRELAVVHLVGRIQGLMFAKNNPKHISGFDDLKRDDISLVNRQSGSGTRVLLDFKLRKLGIEPSRVSGYGNEVNTHVALANVISRGEADAGLGIEAAARASGLDFLPLIKESYDLVIPAEKFHSNAVAKLLEIITSSDFKSVIANIEGYDISETGSVIFVNSKIR